MKIKITSIEPKKEKIKYPCLMRYGTLYAIAVTECSGIQIDGTNMAVLGEDDDNGGSWDAAGFRPTNDTITFN